jgi:hypothetical protein
MSFILVIVPMPDMADFKRKQAWSSFYTFAKVDSLKESEGVFYIDDTAWLFDTRKALPKFALLTHQAHESGMQLHSFQLDSAMLRSQVVSSPKSDDLEAFLAS